MGLFDQLTGKKNVTFHYKAEDDSPEVLALDAAISETHNSTAKATQHPIEDGSNVSDHIIFDGYTFNVEGIISDDPISLLGTVLGNAGGAVGNLVPGPLGNVLTSGLTAGVSGLLGGGGKPSKNAYDTLAWVQEEGIPLIVVTGLRSYINMALENLNINRTAKTARSLRFTATLRQIQIAVSELVEVPLGSMSSDIAHSGSKLKKLGSKASGAASSAVSSKGSSVLAKVFL